MSNLAEKIRLLVSTGDYEISDHGVTRLAQSGVLIEWFAARIESAVVVEEYPAYHKGACVLFLSRDEFRLPMHLLWGTPLGKERPAFLITAYRPDPQRWSQDFLLRKQS